MTLLASGFGLLVHADAQLPDYDDGDDFNPGMDTFDRAFAYKMKQVLRKSPVLPGKNSCLTIALQGFTSSVPVKNTDHD